jgi:hypothetical protein
MTPQEIINALDAPEALRALDEKSFATPEEEIALWCVSFPLVEDNEAEELFRDHVLDFFTSDVPLRETLIKRYTFQGNFQKNTQREFLKKALLENTEMIGDISLGKTLSQLDAKYPPETREKKDIQNFLLDISLPKDQKALLEKIVFVYDDLIASPIMSIFDYVALQRQERAEDNAVSSHASLPSERQETQESFSASENMPTSFEDSPETSSQKSSPPLPIQKKPSLPTKDHPLIEAMRKFPRIGRQNVTSEKLTMRGSKDEVFPTVKSWITI